MAIHLTLHAREVLWSPLPVDEVLHRLQLGEVDGDLAGDLVGDLVDERVWKGLYKPSSAGQNSWRPRLTLQLSEAGGGTLVELRMGVHPAVLVFTVIHGMMMLGISWLIAVAAFSSEATTAIDAVGEVVQAEAIGWAAIADQLPVSDPTTPGAELRAPASLKVRTDLDRVRLGVRHKNWTGEIITTVELDAGGLTLHPGGTAEQTVAWQDFVGARVLDDHTLQLRRTGGEPLSIPGSLASMATLEWLASYIDTRAKQWTPSVEEVQDFEVNRRRLEQMARKE